MGYGIAAGDLIGVRGREGDVAFAQRWATVWLTTAVCCLGVSGLAGTLATSIYEDAARLSRLITRLMVALVVSLALAVLIGFVSFSIITSSHHSVVR
jgi:F0F1-type ATP synthase membrane subunit c/vacuolar-type H+-ATPase subunit K